MRVIALLIGAGGLVAGTFLALFAWAVRSGQFDDTVTPPIRILLDEPRPLTPPTEGSRHAASRT